LSFYSSACVKSEFLVKRKGIWYITPEGEAALKLEPIDFLKALDDAYRVWESNRQKEPSDEVADGEEVEEQGISFDEIEQISLAGFEKHINAKNAYEFQDLAAALLRGMGYYTPFVAPKGKDGGVDIVAYRDPLGTESPRIQVQVKHRPANPSSVQEIRQLMGLLQKEGNVGIFISTGGFTTDAKSTARSSHIHVELIDLPRFIILWQEFYSKLSDEDKNMLPLTDTFHFPLSRTENYGRKRLFGLN
jgi:restriction system protein